jgi:hypothetical protein
MLPCCHLGPGNLALLDHRENYYSDQYTREKRELMKQKYRLQQHRNDITIACARHGPGMPWYFAVTVPPVASRGHGYPWAFQGCPEHQQCFASQWSSRE